MNGLDYSFVATPRTPVHSRKSRLKYLTMASDTILGLVDEIKKQVLEPSAGNGHGHSRLLQLVDDLKLAIETPTETVLRLIYQVRPINTFKLSVRGY